MAEEKFSYVVAKESASDKEYVTAVKASNAKSDEDGAKSEAEEIQTQLRRQYGNVRLVPASEFEKAKEGVK